MILLDLFESVDDDVAASKLASRIAIAIFRAINDGAQRDGILIVNDYAPARVFKPATLGLIDDFPFMSKWLLLITTNHRSRTYGGKILTFKRPTYDHFTRAIVLMVPEKITDIRAILTPKLIEVLKHELIHVLDLERTSDKILHTKSATKNMDLDIYYNHAAEFNAYYHQLVDNMTGLIAASEDGESILDLARDYDVTGDFKADMATLIGRTGHMKEFFNYLNDDRRKALLKRLYKLHRKVVNILDREADEKGEGVGTVSKAA